MNYIGETTAGVGKSAEEKPSMFCPVLGRNVTKSECREATTDLKQNSKCVTSRCMSPDMACPSCLKQGEILPRANAPALMGHIPPTCGIKGANVKVRICSFHTLYGEKAHRSDSERREELEKYQKSLAQAAKVESETQAAAAKRAGTIAQLAREKSEKNWENAQRQQERKEKGLEVKEVTGADASGEEKAVPQKLDEPVAAQESTASPQAKVLTESSVADVSESDSTAQVEQSTIAEAQESVTAETQVKAAEAEVQESVATEQIETWVETVAAEAQEVDTAEQAEVCKETVEPQACAAYEVASPDVQLQLSSSQQALDVEVLQEKMLQDVQQPETSVTEEVVPQGDKGFLLIEHHLITPNPDQPRKHFSAHDHKDFVEGLRNLGQLTPIQVFELPQGSEHKYMIIEGERRWRACKEAGILLVKVTVEQIADQKELLLRSTVANHHRKSLCDMDTARALSQIKSNQGWTDKQIGECIGESAYWVTCRLRLLKLVPEVQALLSPELPEKERLRFTAALNISFLKPEQQLQAAKEAVEKRLSVERLRATVRKDREKISGKKKGRRWDDFRTLSRFLRNSSEKAQNILALGRKDLKKALEIRTPEQIAELRSASNTLITQLIAINRILDDYK